MNTITRQDGQGTTAPLARRCVLIGGLSLGLTALARRSGGAASKPTISVHKSPT
jgi:hypothetical protein